MSPPSVRFSVEWGDGKTSESEQVSINRMVQLEHVYERIGYFSVVVRALNPLGLASRANSPGETPNPDMIIPVRIIPNRADMADPTKWRGLAAPIKGLKEAIASVQDVFAPVFTQLAVTAQAGQTSITVTALEEQFDVNSMVILSQNGKMFSTARVLARYANVIHLDSALNDDYSLSATVELRRQSIIRRTESRTTPPPDWFFPSSADNALIKSAVRSLLATRHGERVMRVEVGSRLDEIPFEQNDGLTSELIRTEVAEVISSFEPRARVADIKFTRDPANNEIGAKIILQLADASSSFDIEFALRPV